jgi:hypothetical protein
MQEEFKINWPSTPNRFKEEFAKLCSEFEKGDINAVSLINGRHDIYKKIALDKYRRAVMACLASNDGYINRRAFALQKTIKMLEGLGELPSYLRRHYNTNEHRALKLQNIVINEVDFVLIDYINKYFPPTDAELEIQNRYEDSFLGWSTGEIEHVIHQEMFARVAGALYEQLKRT